MTGIGTVSAFLDELRSRHRDEVRMVADPIEVPVTGCRVLLHVDDCGTAGLAEVIGVRETALSVAFQAAERPRSHADVTPIDTPGFAQPIRMRVRNVERIETGQWRVLLEG